VPGLDPMPLSPKDSSRIDDAMRAFMAKRRPPEHLRGKVDLSYRLKGQSLEIFELRPAFQGKPGQMHEHPVAKATFVIKHNHWRVYWMRRDLRWHSYQPAPTASSIESFCKLVDEDRHGCFFG
jgi:Protein of unknown function (DUF3024)